MLNICIIHPLNKDQIKVSYTLCNNLSHHQTIGYHSLYEDVLNLSHLKYIHILQIKISAQYRHMLPWPKLFCQKAGLRAIERNPDVPDKSSRVSLINSPLRRKQSKVFNILNFCSFWNRHKWQYTYTTGKKCGIFFNSSIFHIFVVCRVFLFLKHIPTSRYYFWGSWLALNSKMKSKG